MTPQPHPQRCENCSNWLDANCMVIEKWLSEQEYNMIEMVGCASFNLIGSQIRSRPAPSLTESEIANKILRMVESDEWQKEHDAAIAAKAREKLFEAIRAERDPSLDYVDWDSIEAAYIRTGGSEP